MKIIVLGSGVVGVTTAWYLRSRGHDVQVIDRQENAALETSYGNGAQISVCNCVPWADAGIPLKAMKWMLRRDSPLLIRPRWPLGEGWYQYSWLLKFLAQCNKQSFSKNLDECLALGRYSQSCFSEIVAATNIQFNHLKRGILHYYIDQSEAEEAFQLAKLMKASGVDRQVLSADEIIQIEPALQPIRSTLVGGTFTASDESGDCLVFTQELVKKCQAMGVQFLWNTEVHDLICAKEKIIGVKIRRHASDTTEIISADHYVVSLANETAPLLRRHGVFLDIYPGKGYSATLPIRQPEKAPFVSLLDDGKKVAISRLGDRLRIAGTIEIGDYNTSLSDKTSRVRCELLLQGIESIFPGVCDTRAKEDGGDPQFWTGLRPSTPRNLPYVGRTTIKGLWVNSGHGTLGYTLSAGSGKAIAELIDNKRPDIGAFTLYGY
jgi:D-amino-acid dehydrogenase